MPPAPKVVLPFDHHPAAAREARRALEPLLADDDPIRDDVLLSASEIVTNVIRHTNGGGELRVWDPQPHLPLRIEVEDTSPMLPKPLPIDPRRIGGRGMTFVTTVSDAWGAFATPAGKTVWAEFDRGRR